MTRYGYQPTPVTGIFIYLKSLQFMVAIAHSGGQAILCQTRQSGSVPVLLYIGYVGIIR